MPDLQDLVRLRRVRDRMDREYAQPLDVEALARDAHMSPGHFSRRFRQAGGERQRLKLATHLGEKGGRARGAGLARTGAMSVFVLDEPTTGLHLADVEQLLRLLDRLVESGKSVIVIEHHQAVMAHADWIVDLGPGAGHDGGRIVFEGTPADLVAARSTLTGEHLAAYVGA